MANTLMAAFDADEKQNHVPMQTVINKVKAMARDHEARQMAQTHKLAIQTVSWEDCARSKNSSWGPCISDMTLQVDKQRMPVIRAPNFTDTTWDVEMDKIPVVVGNHDSNPGAKLTTVSLRQYLEKLNDYMTAPPKDGQKLDLIAKELLGKQTDQHVIMSSQCCFLPIEKGKETKFSVALFNYQSKPKDPAVLVIVSTSKGTSAQIVEGRDQELVFNNNGQKADFIGQRLTDNRIERNVSIHGAMTKQEKQDNCIVVIQVPLKQKPKEVHVYGGGGYNSYQQQNSFGDLFGSMQAPPPQPPMYGGGGGDWDSFGAMPEMKMAQCVPQCAPPMQSFSMPQSNSFSFNSGLKTRSIKGKSKSVQKEKAEVEAAIVKIAPKTVPVCVCGGALEKVSLAQCYPTASGSTDVVCDGCGEQITAEGTNTMVWHCPKGKSSYKHRNGYDLCLACGEKQLKFDELNGLPKVERDCRYPIRVTLQYYKSTANGVLDADIMAAISKMLATSRKQADFVGSLVTDTTQRPTEPDLVTQNEVKVVHHPAPAPWDPFAVQPDASDALYVKIAGALKTLKIDMKYLAEFKKQEVTDEDLKNLDKQDLKELIPTMGPRNKFWKWLESETAQTGFMDGLL